MKTIKLKLTIAILTFVPIIAFAQLKETRKVENFSKVHSSGMFDVELVKGNQEGVKIATMNFPLDKVVTEVENGTLKIYKEKLYRPRRNAKVKVLVTYKSISELKNSGSGDILCKSDIVASETEFHSSGSGNLSVEGNVKSDFVEVRNSGSGNIHFAQIEAKKLNMGKSGSGNLRINSGKVERQELNSTGSGNMMLGGLESDICYIKISGSGNSRVHANKELNAKISGSGNIQYKGKPTIDAKTSGSGNISSY